MRASWPGSSSSSAATSSATRELFDRVAKEVLGLPGDAPDERRAAARDHAPAAILELFEERLPAMAADLAAGRRRARRGRQPSTTCCWRGSSSTPGQHALLDDLDDGVMPGVRQGIERVERDERWHVGFGLRCLIETQPSADLLDDLLVRAEEAAEVWATPCPAATREQSAKKVAHRLRAAKLTDAPPELADAVPEEL